MKKKITIIHFSPLELYPPIMNLLDYLASYDKQIDVSVLSTEPNSSLNRYENSNIKIKRFQPIIPTDHKLIKLGRYITFYVLTFFRLFGYKPESILYFETLSALPAIWFNRIKKDINIMVHYHEIVTIEELNDGRALNKFINNIERKHYTKYKWISQTNEARLTIFAKQYGLKKDSSFFHTLPNYPPQSWLKQRHKQREKDGKIKLLHIGSISKKGMYLEELLDQFGSHPNYTLDFYSHKFTDEVKTAIQLHDNCTIHGAINYHEIPRLKGRYDVGLVLYKALSINVKYCAPNKIFEYLALDLDVWCSDKLITAKQHERTDCYPKMLMFNFEKLAEFDWQAALNREGLEYVPSPYVCEQVYEKLIEELSK